MQTAEFLAQMELYYGQEYGPELPIIGRYLSERSDRYRDELAQVIVLRFSRKWAKLPSVADFEEHRIEVRDRLAASCVALPAPAELVNEAPDPLVAAKLAELKERLTFRAPEPKEREEQRQQHREWLDWATGEEGWPMPSREPK